MSLLSLITQQIGTLRWSQALPRPERGIATRGRRSFQRTSYNANSMEATLNVFQRLALQWDQIHPYNAAQALKIRGAPDPARLQDAWHDTLNDLGLGRVHVDGGSFRYECLNGELSRWGVRIAPAGTALDDYISEQLNKPFDDPLEPPFRPFVVLGDGFYYAGVSYHHWVADSVSIRTVLREWFARLHDPQAAHKTPVRLPQGGYGRFFGISRNPAGMGQGLLTAAQWASSLRKARRYEEHTVNGSSPDFSVRIAVTQAPDGFLERVHDSARRAGVTLNDLFMAAIARVCDQMVPLRHRPRRHSLALGSIVDLRPYAAQELSDAFGLFLGFTNVVCRHGDLRDRGRLLRFIASQNARQKLRGMPQASAMRMLAGVAAGKLWGPRGMAAFYQKHVPLAGGISNVNLNRCWATRYHPDPLMDYIRVSPTGPLMPVVFATTTLGKQFHFVLTYRPSVIPVAQVPEMTSAFLCELEAIARDASTGG